jgi:hypothetical protein
MRYPKSLRLAGLAGLCAIVMSGLTGVAQASARADTIPVSIARITPSPAGSPGASGVPAPFPASGARARHSPAAAVAVKAQVAKSCKPVAQGDNVHISSTPPPTASGHGSWKKGTCTVSRASVTVQLQEFFSDGVWRNKGTPGHATVPPGGGSGKRATGRADCAGTALAGWRSIVTVTVSNGEQGHASHTTPAQNLHCTHA